ncbi:MAG: glucuronate isomerase [Rikenellaceae bacterium]
MKPFNDENFLLQSPTAERLYHDYAASLPIIDYHCHLNPKEVAENREFETLYHLWLEGDHYKWRAMRTNGVEERYITGDATPWEKFQKWAETVPYTMRNPLYHWSHLELKSAFGVKELLSPSTAKGIYDHCNERLTSGNFKARDLMQHYKVEAVCTTDDPIDTLEYHVACREDGFATKVLPTWRADKSHAINNPAVYCEYIAKLSAASGVEINSYSDLIDALQNRHDYFETIGCKLSDYGLDKFFADEFTQSEVDEIFKATIQGKTPTAQQISKFKSAILLELCKMDAKSGWTQQFHYGTIRNNNSKMFSSIGPDTGFDSIGDFSTASEMSKFFDRLNSSGELAKSIIYNLNPKDNEVIATMIGNFQNGDLGAGHMQFGSAWWFLDQKDGMEKQINSLSVLGLLSRFVGMLTDSRSFVSYPRHDYFRRILCNLVGNDIDNGILPGSEIEFIGKEIIEAVCYKNAKNYFKF